jgi:hypothetical protein
MKVDRTLVSVVGSVVALVGIGTAGGIALMSSGSTAAPRQPAQTAPAAPTPSDTPTVVAAVHRQHVVKVTTHRHKHAHKTVHRHVRVVSHPQPRQPAHLVVPAQRTQEAPVSNPQPSDTPDPTTPAPVKAPVPTVGVGRGGGATSGQFSLGPDPETSEPTSS